MANNGNSDAIAPLMIRDIKFGPLGPRKELVGGLFDIDALRRSTDSVVNLAVSRLAENIDAEAIERELRETGKSASIAKVTTFLNKKPLDDTTRLLLSTKGIYLKSLKAAIEAVDEKYEDTEGIADGVLRLVAGARKEIVREFVKDVLKARDVAIEGPRHKDKLEATVDRFERTFTIAAGKVDKAVWEAYEDALQISGLPEKVAEYLAAEGVPKQPDSVINAMSEYLLRFVRIKSVDLKISKHQEFFALAFEYARGRGRGQHDPIDAARTKGARSEWDYQVEHFDAVEEQAVIAENILVAGALDYLWQLGENMGVFKIADAVILEWGAGVLDVTDEAGDKLYRYYKLREERSSEEERGMLYRRVLGRGEAEVLSDAVVNDAFSDQWHKLMSEVARYIRKSETVELEKVRLSSSAIHQAARDLQFNLTEFGTGLAHKQAFEIYKHFEEAMEVLGDPQVVEHYSSGRRKNVWAVIERIAKVKFGTSVNISALKTLAVEGNKVFRWLAEFRFAQPTSSTLQDLLDAAEAWIIAQAEVQGTGPAAPEGEEEDVESELDKDGSSLDDVDENWDA